METRLLTAVGPISEQTAQAVHELVRLCTDKTGVAPISEQPLLWLHDPRAHVAHIVATKDNALVAYAQADLSDPTEITIELAVHPDLTDLVLERRLLEAGAYVADENASAYSVWLHGPYNDYIQLFEENGFSVVRSISRRAAPLQIVDDTPDPAIPADPAHNVGFGRHAADSSANRHVIRAFQPGIDDEAWVRANAEAFAWHPEQGRLTLHDLHARMHEPWFDAALFLVAPSETRPDELDGFSWLKVPEGATSGEIYALATVPEARGRGLGRELLTHSLELLHARGLGRVDLYVETTNDRALALYDSFGFEQIELHSKMTRPPRV
ncbi:mycothiol synthase [Populibacterium corticicola]|uniref:Mycothiol synthase n=1 Tax=Populibacterium corticicola TaxID=1812826 RepID=A0ABW5XJ47_9MICO